MQDIKMEEGSFIRNKDSYVAVLGYDVANKEFDRRKRLLAVLCHCPDLLNSRFHRDNEYHADYSHGENKRNRDYEIPWIHIL